MERAAPLTDSLPAAAPSAPGPAPRRLRLLGWPVDLMRPDQMLGHVEGAIQSGRRAVVANHNLNSLNLIRRLPAMRAFYEAAEVVQIDSTPLIAFARLLGLPVRPVHRSTYLDWRDDFWAMAARKGWRVFYLGGTAKTGHEAVLRLTERHPGLMLEARSGYFDATRGGRDDQAVLDRIAAFRPNVLMIGMGMPRQEIWAAECLDALPDCVILNVGAAFDYEAGVQRAAPRWMGRAGLEWLYRLACDPRRLFRRYLVEPWALTGPALRDMAAAVTRRASHFRAG